jgi:BON domain
LRNHFSLQSVVQSIERGNRRADGGTQYAAAEEILMLESKFNASMGLWMATMVLVTACALSPPRSPEEIAADETTAERVSAALNANPVFFYGHVDVRVDRGVAHLSGYVWDTDALYQAKKIAAGVPGVIDVVDEMELEREGERDGGHSGSG